MSSELFPESSPRDRSPLLFGIIAAIGITLLFQAGAIIAGLMIPPDATGPLLTAIPLGLAQLAVMLLPTLYLYRAQTLAPSELFRFRAAPVVAYVAAAVGTFALWQILQSYLIGQELVLARLGLADTYHQMERESESFFIRIFSSGNLLELAVALIVGGGIPGLSEELLFRGVAQRSFERVLRPASAIVLSAFLFASLHLNPVTWVPLFTLGCFFGYVAWRTGSIYPTVLSHFLFNIVSIVTLYRFGGEPLPAAGGVAHTLDDFLATLLPSGVAIVLLGVVLRWFHARPKGEDGGGESEDGG